MTYTTTPQTIDDSFVPREVCLRCLRPKSVCYCHHLTSIETKTRIVLLQHPRERYVPIGTARMATLCLPNSELHVGIEWEESSVLRKAISDPLRPAVLLYPGEDALDVMQTPPEGPVTLVVVDGTWWQAKKLIKENPCLAALPRYAFTPPTLSDYRIRKEPHPACVSTLEALVHVLGALEGDAARFQPLLAPFRAMVDTQIHCQETLHGARTRHRRKPKPVRSRIPEVLRERPQDLVCVVAEANAWPYGHPARDSGPGEELVQWAAIRLMTGEVLDYVTKPIGPLAPRAPFHLRLSLEEINAGGSLDGLRAAWRAFVRDTDVLVAWGRYPVTELTGIDGFLPETRVDLRRVVRGLAEEKTMEILAAHLEGPSADVARGRAGERLAQLAKVTKCLALSAPGRENEALSAGAKPSSV